MSCLIDDEMSVGVGVDLDEFELMHGSQRDAEYMRLERERRSIRAMQAAMINRVQRSGSYVDDGHRSVACWLGAVVNCSLSTARYDVKLARMFRDLPSLADALADGDIGDDQIRLLAGLYGNDRVRPYMPDADDLLTDLAATMRLDDFKKCTERFNARADPDGTHRDHDNAVKHRKVRISRVGHHARVEIHTDAVTAGIIEEIIDAHAEAEFLTDVATNRAEHGEAAHDHGLPRTAAQRQHDALLAIVLKSADSTATTAREPIVNILTTEAELVAIIRRHFGDDGNALYRRLNSDLTRDDAIRSVVPPQMRLCETVNGVPVDPDDLLVAALTGYIRRVVVDSAGRVIDLGRRCRLFRGAAREAVLLGGHTCTMPGCGLCLLAALQIDHLASWARARGHTKPGNGGGDCRHHNITKDELRITVMRDETGWHWFRADGTEIAPRPDRPRPDG